MKTVFKKRATKTTAPTVPGGRAGSSIDLIGRYLKVVDLVCELVDARCPKSSGSLLASMLAGSKQRLLVLNKADLADPRITRAWLDFFGSSGREAVAVNAKGGRGMQAVRSIIEERTLRLEAALAPRGRRSRGLRVAVLGLPNTGKSTFLNRLIGRHSMRTGDRPGLTRGPQWVHLDGGDTGGISVLDTPGIIAVGSVKPERKLKLAAIGALDAHAYRVEAVGEWLLAFLKENYPSLVRGILHLSPEEDLLDHGCDLEHVARSKGFVIGGGAPDTLRAASFLLESFRSGKLGGISLERPCQEPGAGSRGSW